ncbi:MAG: hypothetical protein ACMVO3_22250 [Thalassobaculum sp.]
MPAAAWPRATSRSNSLCASYDEIFSGMKTLTAEMAEADRRAFFHDTALRIYRPV